jgi:hypothetical protein
MYDWHAIGGKVHVQLDSIRAELDRTKECGQRVFGELALCASMTDSLDAWSGGARMWAYA